MKIKDIIEYIDKNRVENYIADEFVANGYGQTTGGYMKGEKDGCHPSQYEHFINYYSNHLESSPTFANLWCPELMLFIAEALKVDTKEVCEARDIVISYEEENALKGHNKNATYLPKDILVTFKNKLKLYKLCKILKENDDWKTIEEEISKL